MAYRDSVFIDEDRILHIEAEEAVKEIAFAVQGVDISKILPMSDDLVYLNMVTKEKDILCVELTVQGFRVVAVYAGPVITVITTLLSLGRFRFGLFLSLLRRIYI